MEPVEWPLSLPDWLRREGHSETEGDTVLRTQMEYGQDKVRKRFTKGIDSISSNMLLSKEQKPIFKEFFRTSLGGGALKFKFKDPYTQLDVVYRFSDMPVYTEIGGGWVNVTFNVQVIP